jgi:hypothetical protein
MPLLPIWSSARLARTASSSTMILCGRLTGAVLVRLARTASSLTISFEVVIELPLTRLAKTVPSWMMILLGRVIGAPSPPMIASVRSTREAVVIGAPELVVVSGRTGPIWRSRHLRHSGEQRGRSNCHCDDLHVAFDLFVSGVSVFVL